jgi:hypothetical protein
MRKFIAFALLSLPMAASADYLDIWDYKLKDGCDLSTHMQIVKDFNQWAAKYGYRGEVAVSAFNNDMGLLRLMGRTKDATDSAKVWDAWVTETSDPNSVAGKLSARFDACQVVLSRTAFDIL